MNISIQEYRVRIGLHNSFRCKRNGCYRCNHSTKLYLAVIYDILGGLAPATGLRFVLLIVGIFNYLLDIFQEHILSNHSTSWSVDTCPSQASISIFKPNSDQIEHRLIFSCIVYCIIYIMQEIFRSLHTSNFKKLCIDIYSRLFYKKSFIGCCINIYSIWLLSLNLLLIILTIPNIINPGPVKELNVLYHNVEGFVNLRDKSPSPQLFNSKVIDFQGHILHEKPDIVMLNETWLKSPVLDSEIFPNNGYKVFRRDKSVVSTPS